jgi:mRNA-degrading endonuclease RelE of RelBE toxin-antitoxin system
MLVRLYWNLSAPFLENKGFTGNESELNNLFLYENFCKTKYENLFFLSNISDAKKKGLPEEETEEWERKKNSYIPENNLPREFEEFSCSDKPDIVFSFKSLAQFNELPKEVKSKVPKTLIEYILNPRISGLRTKKINKNGETMIRCRIDQTYRIHFNPLDSKKSKLIIREIGPHKLEGIG